MTSCPELMDWLENRGCPVARSSTYRFASERLTGSAFDLILCEYQLPDRTAFPLVDRLTGSSSTLFFSRPLEDDFLWLEMIRRGVRHNCSTVLRSAGLGAALDDFLIDLETARNVEKLAEEITAGPFVHAAAG